MASCTGLVEGIVHVQFVVQNKLNGVWLGGTVLLKERKPVLA